MRRPEDSFASDLLVFSWLIVSERWVFNAGMLWLIIILIFLLEYTDPRSFRPERTEGNSPAPRASARPFAFLLSVRLG
jgi:hypothetical protein